MLQPAFESTAITSLRKETGSVAAPAGRTAHNTTPRPIVRLQAGLCNFRVNVFTRSHQALTFYAGELFSLNAMESPKTTAIHLTQHPFALIKYGPWGQERWLSGRKRRFAKPLYGLNRTEGSNPSLSAIFACLIALLSLLPPLASEHSLHHLQAEFLHVDLLGLKLFVCF